MTRLTRLLVWLLSKRPDVAVQIQVDAPQRVDRIDYLEDCYELNPAFDLDRPFHGGSKTQRRLDEPR